MVTGFNKGTIDNCTTRSNAPYASMIYNSSYATYYSGSIAGRNDSGATIKNCINYGDIYSIGYKGAITGQNLGVITNCTNYGQLLP